MKHLKTYVALVSISFLALFGFFITRQKVHAPDIVACTEEAKLCSDGSAVGRAGPLCEFAECPSSMAAATSTSVKPPVVKPSTGNTFVTSLNKKISSQGVSLTLSQVIEDSRCPAEVTCIQAGVVRVKGELVGAKGKEIVTLSLGMPYLFSGTRITLVTVTPKKSVKKEIDPSLYRFEIKIVKAVY